MAFSHPKGLLPAEVAFLCEMEMVTIVPRQRLERLDLLGGPTNPLVPPYRTNLPLWLAILLKRQRRINILAPPWMDLESLREILEYETTHYADTFAPAPPLPPLAPNRGSDYDTVPRRNRDNNAPPEARAYDTEGQEIRFSPPFLSDMTSTAKPDALPYHYYEFAEMLLDAAADDIASPDDTRSLLRDIREVRLAKMRKGFGAISDGSEVMRLDGVSAMELAESRQFIMGVMSGLSALTANRQLEDETLRGEREDTIEYDGYEEAG